MIKYLSLLFLLLIGQVKSNNLPIYQEPIEIKTIDVGSPNQGNVAYSYNIGTYEVTNEQYCAFLNSIGKTDTHHLFNFDSSIYSGITRTGTNGSYNYLVKENFQTKPVNYVTWLNCIRFVNWLHNGQQSGSQSPTTTEDGAYTLTGNDIYDYLYCYRNSNARWALPSIEEWKKSAYYDPESDSFYALATQNNSITTKALCNQIGTAINPSQLTINYGGQANWNGSPGGNVITCGSCGATSYWGTYDQNGNVSEWTEATSFISPTIGCRNYTGGGYSTPNAANLTIMIGPVANLNDPDQPGYKQNFPGVGFRVVNLQ